MQKFLSVISRLIPYEIGLALGILISSVASRHRGGMFFAFGVMLLLGALLGSMGVLSKKIISIVFLSAILSTAVLEFAMSIWDGAFSPEARQYLAMQRAKEAERQERETLIGPDDPKKLALTLDSELELLDAGSTRLYVARVIDPRDKRKHLALVDGSELSECVTIPVRKPFPRKGDTLSGKLKSFRAFGGDWSAPIGQPPVNVMYYVALSCN